MKKQKDTLEIVEANMTALWERLEGEGQTAASTVGDAIEGAHECAQDNGIEDPREVRALIITELNEIIRHAKECLREVKRPIFEEGR